MKKLVIAERQWSAYSDRMAAGLGDGWRVVANIQSADALDEELPGADALLALEIPRANLRAATGLKLFLYPGAGILRANPGDYPAGCQVVNVFEHGAAVAEYVMASLLMWVTGLPGYAESFRRGSWAGSGRMGGVPHGEICGKTLGLIGYGTIGRAVAERALAFGMPVLAIAKRPAAAPPVHFLGGPPDMPRLLEESDFLTLACPYTPETHGLLGAAELARMKPSAYLVNVARAEIVDERALFEALRDGRLGGAALDVWYQYPQNEKQTLHGSAFAFHELPNAMVTPHLAGWTEATVERRIARMTEALTRHERGEAQTRVVLVGTWAPA
jgi:phosphoglycerate dehydrogenase-like enzyme